MKEKLDYITNLRFPLILGVVLDHASICMPDSLRGDDTASVIFSMLQMILKISVPVFFIISGFLFFHGVTTYDRNQYVAKLRSRIHTLLIPYILWTLICLIYLILKQCPTILHTHSIDSVRDLFTWQIFWMFRDGHPLHIPLWYIRDLILMSLCSPLVWILMSKLRHIGMLIIFALYMLVNIDPGISFPISVFYFSLGCYFAICHIDICYIAGRLRWSIVPIMVLMLFSMLIDNIQLARFAHIIFAVCYLLLVAFLTNRYQFAVPQWLTDSVFFVYAMHTIAIMMILNKIFIRLIPDSSMAIFLFARLFIVGILTTMICVALYHLFKRFIPKTIAILTGNR